MCPASPTGNDKRVKRSARMTVLASKIAEENNSTLHAAAGFFVMFNFLVQVRIQFESGSGTLPFSIPRSPCRRASQARGLEKKNVCMYDTTNPAAARLKLCICSAG